MGLCFASTSTSIRDDSSRLPSPFMEQVIKCVFQAGWDTPVVLGRDEDECIELLDEGRP